MSRIEFTDASVTYPGGLVALKNVDLVIEQGELVVIVGLSGAGKSTLLRAINGLVPVTGSVTVDGREVVDASNTEIREIRSDVGMIFQTFNLIQVMTALENVTLPGGGTTDYAVEIYYEAIKQGKYTCPLGAGTYLDMMYMPDAVEGAIQLMEADPDKLNHRNAYNVTAMSFDPEKIAAEVAASYHATAGEILDSKDAYLAHAAGGDAPDGTRRKPGVYWPIWRAQQVAGR